MLLFCFMLLVKIIGDKAFKRELRQAMENDRRANEERYKRKAEQRKREEQEREEIFLRSDETNKKSIYVAAGPYCASGSYDLDYFFSGAFVCTGTGQWHVSLCESGRSSDRFPDGT